MIGPDWVGGAALRPQQIFYVVAIFTCENDDRRFVSDMKNQELVRLADFEAADRTSREKMTELSFVFFRNFFCFHNVALYLKYTR